MPVAYGTFDDDTMVLHCVCRECNNSFSREFEQAVYRGGWEGQQRFFYGIKPVEKSDEIDSRRIQSIALNEEFAGLRLHPVTNDIETQIRIRRQNSEEFVQLTLADLRRLGPEDARKYFDFSSFQSHVVRGEFDKLRNELNRLGFSEAIAVKGPELVVPAGTMLRAEQVISMDVKNARAVVKIALNCLAHHCGADYVLNKQFDAARELVTRGVFPEEIDVQAVGMKMMASKPRPKDPYHLFLASVHENRIYVRLTFFTGFIYHLRLTPPDVVASAPEEFVKGFGYIFRINEKTARRLAPKQIEFLSRPMPYGVYEFCEKSGEYKLRDS